MDLVGVAELIGAAGGGALTLGLVDRWRYRHKPELDVAALAQRIAETSLQHARAEIERAWHAAERAEQQVDQLRTELAELRRTVATLGADHAQLQTQLHEREAELAETRGQLAAARAELDRMERLTTHAQTAGRMPVVTDGGLDAV